MWIDPIKQPGELEKMYSMLLSTILVQGFSISAISASVPSVQTDLGTLNGAVCANSSLAVFFKFIPFAQPPIGNLRFAPPQPYVQSTQLVGLTPLKLHRPAYSLGAPLRSLVRTQKIGESPGCMPTSILKQSPSLCLDIWTPANATKESSLPVRVWLHGGDDNAGGISDPMYDGCNVPSTDALMVAINYRLGPVGFMALSSAGIRGNQGMQDILLGLEWIQQNIAAFGGDPVSPILIHFCAHFANADMACED